MSGSNDAIYEKCNESSATKMAMMKSNYSFCFLLCLAFLFFSSSNYASEAPRFEFESNLYSHQNSVSRLFYKRLFASDKSALREIRSEIIWGEDLGLGFRKQWAHVTAIFDVTELVPEEIKTPLFGEHDSLIKPKLRRLAKASPNKETQLSIIGSSIFMPTHDNQTVYEEVDLYLHISAFDQLIDLSEFIDIDTSEVSRLVINQNGRARLVPLKNRAKVDSQTLINGFYRELKEGFSTKDIINAYIIFHEDIPIDIETFFSVMQSSNFAVIKRGTHELIAQIDEAALDFLVTQPQVKLVKDYQYHAEIAVKYGRWVPKPLSKIKVALLNEVQLLSGEIRTDFINQEHEIVETEAQLDEFERLNLSSPFNNHKVLLGELSEIKVDFDLYNLVILSHRETSGSISYEAKPAMWVDGELVIAIDRYIGRRGGLRTMDMAQYSLIYLVNKNIDEVVIQDSRGTIYLKNEFTDFTSTRSRLEFERYSADKREQPALGY